MQWVDDDQQEKKVCDWQPVCLYRRISNGSSETTLGHINLVRNTASDFLSPIDFPVVSRMSREEPRHTEILGRDELDLVYAQSCIG
mmetsp:Transcript_23390/g.54333  ORF Transcript_23390/g.54333 Transcript_23390/m.54333 type:complete len:86 (-) Transcript_23390:240-497(-)